MRRTVLLSLIGIVSLGTSLLTGQSRPKPPGTPPAPQHHVYGSLFSIVSNIESEADAAEARGDHSRALALRKHFQSAIGLSDKDAATLKSHAVQANQQVRFQDKKAHDLIDKIRSQTPGGKLQIGQKPPAPPQELSDMQTQRNQMINDHVAALQQSVGPDTFQKIDDFARARFEQAKPVLGPKPPGTPHFPKP